jgi:rod shape-determining protein MreD
MTRSQFIYYAMPLIVLIMALLQATIATQLMVRGVKPDLVLLVVLLATLVYGGQGGLVWAFIGGIGLDLFSGGPFGASSLALMMATLVAALGYRVLSRYHVLVPLGAAGLGTLIYGLVYIGLLGALHTAAQLPLLAGYAIPQHNLPLWPTLQQVVIPAMFYNTTLMLFVMPLLNRVPEQQEVERY